MHGIYGDGEVLKHMLHKKLMLERGYKINIGMPKMTDSGGSELLKQLSPNPRKF